MKNHRISIGLIYDGDIPFIIAKAIGEEAEKVLELAKAHDIPLFEDPELAEYLARFNIGEIVNNEYNDVFKGILEFLILLGRKN